MGMCLPSTTFQGCLPAAWFLSEIREYIPRWKTWAVYSIDYRWDKRRFWLSAHNCQVPTPTSQNLELEEQIRIFPAD